jgi:hypothetical protein
VMAGTDTWSKLSMSFKDGDSNHELRSRAGPWSCERRLRNAKAPKYADKLNNRSDTPSEMAPPSVCATNHDNSFHINTSRYRSQISGEREASPGKYFLFHAAQTLGGPSVSPSRSRRMGRRN